MFQHSADCGTDRIDGVRSDPMGPIYGFDAVPSCCSAATLGTEAACTDW